ncbi:MAG: arginine--tRNA ligase [Candidatus Andersenbacteria bacterium]|nr:arginine--tRNA ligase [Candidatus Andersenbacteria bacterium]MBI3250983.1 arginine--tRNA ligase [Candidatus Andersenbacteria bacterium]
MLNLKKALAADIREGAIAAGYNLKPDQPVSVAHTDKPEHGDYASAIALSLVKGSKQKPLDIVGAIAQHMPKKEYIGKIEAAPPGFLNITISHDWLASKVDDIIEQEKVIEENIGEGKLVNLEFISANPTGPLTLGNARTAFSADTLANVLTAAGFNVTREYYINDAGTQIARLGESVLRRALEQKGIKVEFAEDLYQGEYIIGLAKKITELWKENEGKEFIESDLTDKDLIEKISTEAMEQMLAAIKKTIHDDLRIHFDIWTSERALKKTQAAEHTLAKLKKNNLVYEKDGAVWFKATEFGEAEDKVLVKSSGQYAYIMPDIAYHQNKYDREFDLIFTFLGADHLGQVSKLTAAMKALGNDIEKLHFVVAQWLSLQKDGKEFTPSKRKGNVYSPSDLIAEIGYDAARFFMVQRSLRTHLVIDLDIAKERNERNPVYYVQYAYVRLQSILRKAKQHGFIEEVGEQVPKPGKLMLAEGPEMTLLKALYGLPETVAEISQTFEVQTLAYFAHELARSVHSFYRDVRVLASEDKDVVLSRLQLVAAAKKVLGQTLDLLGISKPDVM